MTRLYRETSRLNEAEGAFKSALEIFEKLAVEHRFVTEYPAYFGATCVNIGDLQKESANLQGALDWYDKAFRKLIDLHQRDQENEFVRQCLREAYAGQAEALTKLGRHIDALAAWEQALTFAGVAERIRVRLARAETLARLGQHAEAVTEAQALDGETSAGGETTYQSARVHALAAVAVFNDTKLAAAEQKKLRERYAVLAVDLFRKAQAAGYLKDATKVEQIKNDPDLKTLAAREDFKKLMAQLEKPKANSKEPRGALSSRSLLTTPLDQGTDALGSPKTRRAHNDSSVTECTRQFCSSLPQATERPGPKIGDCRDRPAHAVRFDRYRGERGNADQGAVCLMEQAKAPETLEQVIIRGAEYNEDMVQESLGGWNMTLHCTAVVERGLLRPTVPVALEEGAQVELIILQPSNGSGRRTPAEILAQIASLPMELGGQEFCGRDHDKILYDQ